jgi:hypothetical protein
VKGLYCFTPLLPRSLIRLGGLKIDVSFSLMTCRMVEYQVGMLSGDTCTFVLDFRSCHLLLPSNMPQLWRNGCDLLTVGHLQRTGKARDEHFGGWPELPFRLAAPPGGVLSDDGCELVSSAASLSRV